jgi:purine-nucleoside phosphorylase
MEAFKNKVLEATAFIQSKMTIRPEIGLQVGTGLGDTAEGMEEVVSIDYEDIPHFSVSTVPTHHGRLLCGQLGGKAVLVMQGRFHYYEGYSMQEVTLPIRVMQLMGVKTLILSNAAGGINPAFEVGDIMVITDHINLTGNNPLVGPNMDAWGPRFPDMSRVYDPGLVALAEKAAFQHGIRIQKGVYVGLPGPSLETGAEIRFLKIIGVDAVGLSTIPEVIAGVHGGMAILGLSVITNMNIPDDLKPALVEDIITAAERAAPSLQTIVREVIEALPI